MDSSIPPTALVAIGTALTGAIIWLAKSWSTSLTTAREAQERAHTTEVELVRDVTAALVSNNEILREQRHALHELAEAIKGTNS